MTGVISKQFGRYEIRSKLGEGGMGEVYAAHDAELDRNVAIKLLPGEFSEDEDRKSRFKQEARVVSALNHPNVITIYEIGENEHGSFLATEFVDGKTLREIIKNESLTLSRILKIVEQVANALVAAHQANIIHRDIKPENIMVRRDSIVKVLDFGLAKPAIETNADHESNKTIPGTVMGSARYMSPEQARGLAVDERTDIWSLGVVLYETLVGHPPFNGETTTDTIAAVIYKEPEPLNEIMPNLPIELHRIVRRALQKDREERYQSVKDFALDIKNLLYEIEHANSGERSGGHVTSSPRFSENPTMIQRTISGNYTTNETGLRSSVIITEPASKWKTILASAGAFVLVAAAVGAIILVAVGAYGFYKWIGQDAQLGTAAFTRPQITRLNTDGKVNNPTISPDGKYVAYVSGEIGNRSLVVRQISTDSTVTIVPPTNLSLHSVSFSPNGDYVYYCQTRSDMAVNTLFQVPTLGGTPKKLIEDVDSTVTFSHDGKRFAFMRHTTASNEDVYFVVNAETLESEELIRSKQTEYDFFSARPSWSPDGNKILVGAGKRDGGLVSKMAVGELSVAEKKFRVLNDEKFYTVGSFNWFSDGSGFLLTGRETQNGPMQIWKASYPGIDLVPVTNDFNDYVEVALADDGRTIVSLKADTIGSIWRISPSGQDRHQITTENRNTEGAGGLLGLSDGGMIYTRNEGKEADLWITDAEGKNPRAVFDEKGWAVSPVFTPDKRYVVFNLQKDKASRIWRMDADGKNAVQLTPDDVAYADFSPQVTADGKWIIFQRQTTNVDRSEFMRIPIVGGPVEVFYSNKDWSVHAPRLSPDGKKIAFVTFNVNTWEKKLAVASIEGEKFGKVERELDYNLINQFNWSPDSRSITAVSSRGGVQNIWRLPIDGNEAKQMTDFKTGRVLNFSWAADARNLLVSRGNTNNDLILIRDADRPVSRDTLAGAGVDEVRRASL